STCCRCCSTRSRASSPRTSWRRATTCSWSRRWSWAWRSPSSSCSTCAATGGGWRWRSRCSCSSTGRSAAPMPTRCPGTSQATPDIRRPQGKENPMRHPSPMPATLPAAVLLALSLAACTQSDAPKTPDEVAKAEHQKRVADEIAMTLQACSYEGEQLRVDPARLDGKAPANCDQMVDRIMDYTGLPKNFVVTAGPVPNALAVIMLDKQRVPQRVIAFNPEFISNVTSATGGDAWAPISIM